jgi:exodeoxyribonuclease VII small subunit
MAQGKKSGKAVKFEEALDKLERIVGELEDGGLPLEDALAKFEEGIKLTRLCSAKLKEAEKKIEILTKKADGTLEPEPFEPGKEKKGKPEAEAEDDSDKPEQEDLLF